MTDEILAVVPARSGSKGLPGKNVKDLHGKPLLAWPIEQGRQSEFVDRVILSTDSEEFAEIGEAHGADVPFLRPADLAQDETPIGDVLVHLLEELESEGEQYDLVVMLEPTSPLRKASDIDAAIEKFQNSELDATSLVSVQEIEEEGHPYFVREIQDGVIESFVETEDEYYQRQQLPSLYQPEGTLYLSDPSTLKTARSFYQERTLPYVVEPWQKYEIDNIIDFQCVSAVMGYKSDAVGSFE